MMSIAIVSVFGEMYLLIAQAMVGLGVVLELRLLTIIAVVTTINVVLSPGFFLITRWTLSERKKES